MRGRTDPGSGAGGDADGGMERTRKPMPSPKALEPNVTNSTALKPADKAITWTPDATTISDSSPCHRTADPDDDQ